MNTEQLIKIMNMTQSDNDHEALTAIRMANGILKRENKSWNALIGGGSNLFGVKHQTYAEWTQNPGRWYPTTPFAQEPAPENVPFMNMLNFCLLKYPDDPWIRSIRQAMGNNPNGTITFDTVSLAKLKTMYEQGQKK